MSLRNFQDACETTWAPEAARIRVVRDIPQSPPPKATRLWRPVRVAERRCRASRCSLRTRFSSRRRSYDAFVKGGVFFWLTIRTQPNRARRFAITSRRSRFPLALCAIPSKRPFDSRRRSLPRRAVFDRRRTLVHHGRIDDRYVSVGLELPAPTPHDLEQALTATLAGWPVSLTDDAGCRLLSCRFPTMNRRPGTLFVHVLLLDEHDAYAAALTA